MLPLNQSWMYLDNYSTEIMTISNFFLTIFTFMIVLFNLLYLRFIYNSNPTYIRAKEIHSENLKMVASDWKGEIKTPIEKLDAITKNPENYCAKIEKNGLFMDIEEHEPISMRLMHGWHEFKGDLIEFDFLKYNLFNKIVDKITSETGLGFKEELSPGDNVFSLRLYERIYNQLENKFTKDLEIRSIKRHDFRIDKEITKGYEKYYTIGGFAGSDQEQQLTKLQLLLEDLPRITEEEGWIDDFNVIHKTYLYLTSLREDLISKIDYFILLPLFPEDCEFINRIKKPFYWRIKKIILR